MWGLKSAEPITDTLATTTAALEETDLPLTMSKGANSSSTLTLTNLDNAEEAFDAILREKPASAASTETTTKFFDSLFDDALDEMELAESKLIPLADRKQRLQRIFSRAASNGESTRIARMLNNLPEGLLDVNAKDEDGSGATPLIFAVCFAHIDVALRLLEAGADPDIQDNCTCARFCLSCGYA
jgi:ankyrin repeat protein